MIQQTFLFLILYLIAETQAYRSKYFNFIPRRMHFHQAAAYCRKRGTTLASIHGDHQFADMHRLMRGKPQSFIGAMRSKNCHKWSNVDGSHFVPHWFAPTKEPNGKISNTMFATVGRFRRHPNFYNDVRVHHALFFVCNRRRRRAYRSRYFYIRHGRANYPTAKRFCARHGRGLATVRNHREFKDLRRLIVNYAVRHKWTMRIRGGHQAWIGVEKRHRHSSNRYLKWRFNDGRKVHHKLWYKGCQNRRGEPNSGSRGGYAGTIGLFAMNRGRFNDAHKSVRIPFICRRRKVIRRRPRIRRPLARVGNLLYIYYYNQRLSFHDAAKFCHKRHRTTLATVRHTSRLRYLRGVLHRHRRGRRSAWVGATSVWRNVGRRTIWRGPHNFGMVASLNRRRGLQFHSRSMGRRFAVVCNRRGRNNNAVKVQAKPIVAPPVVAPAPVAAVPSLLTLSVIAFAVGVAFTGLVGFMLVKCVLAKPQYQKVSYVGTSDEC